MTDEQSISQWDSRGGVPAKLNEKNKLLDEFVAALNGERNADQKRIAEVADVPGRPHLRLVVLPAEEEVGGRGIVWAALLGAAFWALLVALALLGGVS